MFRRRPRRRRPLPPGVRQALARVNGMMAGGQFAEAAAIFGRLFEKAQQRGMIVRAADLALQASRAHFAAADVDAALGQAMQALRLFVRGGRVGRVSLLLSKMTGALREKGYDAQADQLEQDSRAGAWGDGAFARRSETAGPSGDREARLSPGWLRWMWRTAHPRRGRVARSPHGSVSLLRHGDKGFLASEFASLPPPQRIPFTGKVLCTVTSISQKGRQL